MCGSTNAQNTLQAEQLQAYQEANQMMQEEYKNQQAIYGPMAAKFQSIFDMGPSQEGFSAGEKQNLETQVVEGTASNYANAAKATNEQLAAEGGDSSMPSGAADEMKLETATGAAQEKTREETQIEQADYNQGYSEWQQAGEGLMSIAAGENPIGYEQAATSAGSAAGTTAEQIAQEQNSWENTALGIAGDVISQNPHNVFG